MAKQKRRLALLLAVLMTAALLPLNAAAALLPFQDVPRSAWYYDTVQTAYARGIVQGTSRTTFDPERIITREEFLAMLFRASGMKMDIVHQSFQRTSPEVIRMSYFSDIEPNAWYAETVCLAKEMGVTNGVEGVRMDERGEPTVQARFGVGEPVTREQMAAMAARFTAARPHTALRNTAHPAAAFSDMASVSPWAKDAVEALRLAGVLQGDGQQRVHAKDNATRAEAAAVILRLADATERVSFVPEGTAWIQLRNQGQLIDGAPRTADIKDPQAVRDMIRALDDLPVAGEYALQRGAGWLYWIGFYDQNDQYLGGYEFNTNSIDVNLSRLTTALPYFLPWIALVK